MASTYNYLGIELMATGENAGTWGTKTNTNLNIIQQASSGYHSQSIAGGAGTSALLITDGDSSSTADSLTNAARNQVIELTGSITGNRIVTFPDGTEGLKIVFNNTSGGYTVQLKGASDGGSGTTFATTDKGKKMVYMSGSNLVAVTLATDPAGSDTYIQYNNSGAFGGDANLIWNASTGLNIGTSKELRLQDDSGAEYVGMKASNGTTDYTMTWPAGVAGGNGYVLKSTTGGVLSWAELEAGGTAWQAVKTTGFTAVAGQGYFCNTTGGAFTLTLPSSPTIGDEVTFVDYAGTFDSDNLTIGRNSEKINGSAADLTVATERAANTLVYTDGTQGWLLRSN
tara:strand:+ start:93 stop:1115 length:1023 start_codon:yes stop_codon:yes gene_type:complete